MKRKPLLWFLSVVLMASMASLSCGGGGGGSSILDPTFGTAGIVTTAIGTIGDQAHAVAIQGDGKLVAAGYSIYGAPPQWEFALARYNTDGSLDTTFNTSGKVTTPIGTIHDEANAVVIQADGKLVAAGFTDTGSQDEFALVRYNTDGSLDTTFNTTGIVTTAIGTHSDQAFGLAPSRSGDLKNVAAGVSLTNTLQSEFALVSYNKDGSLDTTFNTTGIVTTAIGAGVAPIKPDTQTYGLSAVETPSVTSSSIPYEDARRCNPQTSLATGPGRPRPYPGG